MGLRHITILGSIEKLAPKALRRLKVFDDPLSIHEVVLPFATVAHRVCKLSDSHGGHAEQRSLPRVKGSGTVPLPLPPGSLIDVAISPPKFPAAVELGLAELSVIARAIRPLHDARSAEHEVLRIAVHDPPHLQLAVREVIDPVPRRQAVRQSSLPPVARLDVLPLRGACAFQERVSGELDPTGRWLGDGHRYRRDVCSGRAALLGSQSQTFKICIANRWQDKQSLPACRVVNTVSFYS